MRESTFGVEFADKIERQIGGKVIKIADKSTLGLPDSMHVFDGVTTFFETKIGTRKCFKQIEERRYCSPWGAVNDIRQYEVCKRINKHATVLYVIYYPFIRMTCVLTIEMLSLFRLSTKAPEPVWLIEGDYFVEGHGLMVYKSAIMKRRQELVDKLRSTA